MTIILVQLDALAFSYFNPEYTPFLYQFAQDAASGRLETMLAYDGINASIFTGTWPSKHYIWMRFLRDSRHSPLRFSPFRPLSVIVKGKYLADFSRQDARHNSFMIRGLRRAFRTFNPRHPLFSGGFARIPLEYAHHFSYSITPGTFLKHDFYNGQKTIFGILREHGLSSCYFIGEIESATSYFRAEIDLEEYGLIFVHTLVSLDQISHKYGPFDPTTLSFMRYQDSLIAKFVQTIYDVAGSPDDLHFLFFSDHGMAEVTRHVDISAFLKASLTRKSMVIFVDSTMVRIWGNQKDLDYAREYLTRLDCGKILTESDLERLQIDFQDNRYGDLIFLARPGTVFIPDYFHGSERVKGMHGYESGPVELDGIIILKGPSVPSVSIDKARMVDIFPTMLNIFGLPIPNSSTGRSLL
jgi:predicted AlkP superfamily pyrophosphatase or phosphodiesterase